MQRDEANAAGKRAESAGISNTLQMALEHHQSGQLAQAEALYRQILQLEPNHAEALHFLGVLAHQTGRNEFAVEVIGKALLLKPSYPEAHCNLGLALQAQGRLDQAIEHYRQAISINSNYAEAHYNLGRALKQQGKPDAAIVSYRRAISFRQNFAEAYYNLGNVLKDLGKSDEAVEQYKKALVFNSNFAEPHSNLGFLLQSQNKLDEAIEHCRIALSINPELAEAHNNLGNACKEQGRLVEAAEHCSKAILLKPDFAEAHNNLGNAYKDQRRLDEAIECYCRALSFRPDYAEAYNNMGNALKDQGKLDEAVVQYRKALAYKPDIPGTHSNILYALNFLPELRREEGYIAAREYDTVAGIPLRSAWRAHANDRDPHRRLRVGYVSPDFRHHAVAYFAEPIFAHHDKSKIEIFCYAEVSKEDEYTGRFRQMADHWHSTVGMSDAAVAEMIRGDQIDILVDLAGHTAKNRLLVFARKPAPIQITYLGYLGTTGLSAMDYLITDHYADPEGSNDSYYSERLLRMPNSLWCFRPSRSAPEITPLPALARGYLTFGSFNNFNKIDRHSLDLWGKLLREIPASRLIMLSVGGGETRQSLLHHFSGLGIDAQRLEFHGIMPIDEFRRKILEVDISLDPVTVNGATTTCESLWMGVPVVSLAGNRLVSRAGLSILSTVGLVDFAVTSPESYIRLVAYLADNIPLLAEIRAGLREHLRLSPLTDEAGFTHDLENRYREIWVKWCGSENN